MLSDYSGFDPNLLTLFEHFEKYQISKDKNLSLFIL